MCKPLHYLNFLFSEGTHSSKCDLIDTRKGSSFAVEPEAIIEFGVKQKDEDEESIKERVNLDIKLNVIDEKVEDSEDNNCDEFLAVITVSFEMSPTTTEALEDEVEMVQSDSTDSHVRQQVRENERSGITCTTTTSGTLTWSDNDAGSVMDTTC